MQYKALIFDLDGTAVPSKLDGMPSGRVIKAAHELKGKIKLSSASGRSVLHCRDIWEALRLSDPCIINGGSQIIDPKTEKIIWEQTLPKGTISDIVEISKGYTEQLAINGEGFYLQGNRNNFPISANIVVLLGVKKTKTDLLILDLERIPGLNVHILPSWIEGEHWDIHITDKEATKKHAIEQLIQILKVNKKEVIGVGDGNNDLPLFESVGYRVAMGNAVDSLKHAADYIADTFENDGFAKFLEEKLLKD